VFSTTYNSNTGNYRFPRTCAVVVSLVKVTRFTVDVATVPSTPVLNPAIHESVIFPVATFSPRTVNVPLLIAVLVSYANVSLDVFEILDPVNPPKNHRFVLLPLAPYPDIFCGAFPRIEAVVLSLANVILSIRENADVPLEFTPPINQPSV